jgi:hypothetical protein
LRKSQPYADSYSDRNCYGYTNSYSDCNCNCNCYSYGFAERDADALGDPASAHAKAAAHAVPSADAVSELQKVESKRELARQLASSLLFAAGADPRLRAR